MKGEDKLFNLRASPAAFESRVVDTAGESIVLDRSAPMWPGLREGP